MKKEFDAYAEEFTDLTSFRAGIDDLEQNSEWMEGIRSSTIRTTGIMGIEAGVVAQDHGLPPALVADTATSTSLLASVGGELYCVRDTAIVTLEDTAKISGLALSRVSPDNLATILNLSLEVAKGRTMVLNRFGKASAFLSNNYCKMPQPDLMESVVGSLENQFGGIAFQSGYIDHAFTKCTFALEEMQEELTAPYIAALVKSDKAPAAMMPCVEFRTSDTGCCAATLQPYFKQKGTTPIVLCEPIKVHHKHSTGGGAEGIELFEERSRELFSLFKKSAEKVAEMDSVMVNHPRNALICICKRLNLPRKYGGMVEETLNRELGENPCSWYDLYLYISEILILAKQDGKTEQEMWRLSEAVARTVTLNIHAFDLAGSYAW